MDKIGKIFRHFFIPRNANNQRPKLIHNDIIFAIGAIFLLISFSLSFVKNNYPQVLGLSVNIGTQQLLLLTNEERVKYGLKPLNYNENLALAADEKANNMFTENYWAHVAPSGKTPWYFIKKEGYNYTYAGENLARGFMSSEDVLNAWMASPSHRENILSSNYQDIGFSVKEGALTGERNTVLIVEMFGGKKPLLQKNNQVSQNTLSIAFANSKRPISEIVSTSSLVNRFKFAKNFSQILIIILIVVFFLDFLTAQRKKIYRLAGHNFDHILFLSAVLAFILVVAAGSISL